MGPLPACRRRLTSFSSAAVVLGHVPYGVAAPLSPVAVTATAIVSLCTSMPTNRVGCSMTRLLCLRLHARPSGATLDHCTWRDGSPLQGGHRVVGGRELSSMLQTPTRLVPRAPPLAGPGRALALLPFPTSLG